MTAPAGQPVVSGTTISSATFNTLVGDFVTEITDSASRSGKGAFTAPIRGPDGTVAAPALSFTAEPGTGWYRAAAADLRAALAGVDALILTVTGLVHSAARFFVTSSAANSTVQVRGNRNAADVGADVELNGQVTRTAGLLVQIDNNGTPKLNIDYQGLMALASQAGPLQPASIYTVVTPGTNIAATGASYFKDSNGIVHVQGFVSGSGAAIVNGTVMFNLPAGFRPSDPRQFVAIDSSKNLFGVQVAVNGDVTLIAPVVVNTSGATSIANSGPVLYLDVIQFLARA